MVRHPRDYRWSSYSNNIQGRGADFVRPHPAYGALGADASACGNAYASLFEQPLEQKVVDEIRKATRGGYALGEPRKRRGRARRKEK